MKQRSTRNSILYKLLNSRRRRVATVAAVVAVLFGAAGISMMMQSRAQTPFLYAQGKDLMYNGQKVVLKGTNFDNISAIGSWQGAGMTSQIGTSEEDYRVLSQMGGNHVRFGMTTKWFIDNKANAYQTIDQQIVWAKKHNIWLTPVFFHPWPGNCTENYGNTCEFWTNATYKENMKKLWVEIAARYKDEPVIAGWDLLNEPTPTNRDCGNWWPIAQDWRNAMYAVNPNHLVFIMSCGDSVFWYKFTGNNIVYESHDYAPQAFSHSNPDSTKVYPGSAKDWDGKIRYYDKNAFLTSTDPVLNLNKRTGREWTINNNVPFYSGEWGAMNTYTGADKYVQDRSEIYNQWGVNHAFYTWQHYKELHWGIYQYGKNPLVVNHPDILAAFKISLQGAVKPNFTNTSGDTTAPSVSMTAPATGSSHAAGSTITLSANASDNIGVTKVEFYSGSTLLHTDTTSPYSFAWNTTGQTSGSKTLTAKAFDAGGNTATSSAVTVTITGPAFGVGSINDNQFTYSGTWSSGMDAPAYNGDEKWTATANASYEIRFTGTRARVFTTVDPAHGIMAISVNGGAETLVDSYAPARKAQVAVYTSPLLANGTHTIKVRVTGTKNAASPYATVVADRIDVLQTTTNNSGDVNGDGRVNAVDLSFIISKDGQNYPAADFSGDGVVGAADMAIVLSKWTW